MAIEFSLKDQVDLLQSKYINRAAMVKEDREKSGNFLCQEMSRDVLNRLGLTRKMYKSCQGPQF